MSNVSRWLGPPHWKRKMTLFARTFGFGPSYWLAARNRFGSDRPSMPVAPARSKWRRVRSDEWWKPEQAWDIAEAKNLRRSGMLFAPHERKLCWRPPPPCRYNTFAILSNVMSTPPSPPDDSAPGSP